MKRARAALIVACAASCAGPGVTPRSDPPAPIADAGANDADPPDSGAPAASPKGRCPSPDDTPDEVFGGPWVSFYGPPYNGDSGTDEGPKWSFRPQKLPAISRDGERVLVYRRSESMGAPPSLELVVERIRDGAMVSTTPLLDAAAFTQAYKAALDDAGRRRAFDALRPSVIAHVKDVNAALDAEGWIPLTPCGIDVAAFDTKPSCAMTEQQIQCGSAVRLAYAEPRLDVSVGGRKTRQRKPSWVERPMPAPGAGQTTIPVRGCFGAAFLDATRGIVLVEMRYACHGAGGDWCGAKTTWRVLTLPSALGAAPKPAVEDTCPPGMTAIPAGTFTMGALDGDDDEKPPHEVKVGAFCLDTREVTVADYRACLRAGRCFTPGASRLAGPGAWDAPAEEPNCNFAARGRDAHPMNCAPSSFAAEYCDWAGKRLPSEAEWELAARGTEGRRFPWGDTAPGAQVCWNKAPPGTCAAGASPGDTGPLGLLDMAGNVREWTSTGYALYDGCMAEQAFVTRGGSFAAKKVEALRGARRGSESPSRRAADVGFRCAKTR